MFLFTLCINLRFAVLLFSTLLPVRRQEESQQSEEYGGDRESMIYNKCMVMKNRNRDERDTLSKELIVISQCSDPRENWYIK